MRITERLERMLDKMHSLNDINKMARHYGGNGLSDRALLGPLKGLSELRGSLLELTQLLLTHRRTVEPRIVMRVKKPIDVHTDYRLASIGRNAPFRAVRVEPPTQILTRAYMAAGDSDKTPSHGLGLRQAIR